MKGEDRKKKQQAKVAVTEQQQSLHRRQYSGPRHPTTQIHGYLLWIFSLRSGKNIWFFPLFSARKTYRERKNYIKNPLAEVFSKRFSLLLLLLFNQTWALRNKKEKRFSIDNLYIHNIIMRDALFCVSIYVSILVRIDFIFSQRVLYIHTHLIYLGAHIHRTRTQQNIYKCTYIQ